MTDVPKPPRGPHRRARDAVLTVLVAVVLLALFEGPSVRSAGEEMQPGWERSLVLAVGHPAGWLADRLPLADAANALGRALKSNDDLSGGGAGSFSDRGTPAAAGGVPPVTPDAFDPRALGAKPPPPRPLKTVLVTGDSMTQPLDAEVARSLTPKGIKVVRDAHVGTGISDTTIVDWGKLSISQVSKNHPDAVVMFMGANEGFPMQVGGREVKCCSADWAAEYAYRARRMMDTYRRGGAARVYWLLLPTYRSAARNAIARVVNAGIIAAASPYRAQVRILDMGAIFTPGNRYRDAMPVGGREQIVRQSDGIHLNGTGAQVAADEVIKALRGDFTGP
jgi:lysophospholipase L1-like esterase